MKTVIYQVCGTDGSPHGHGGWSLDPEELVVTDRQYAKIVENLKAGEKDLEAMEIYGLGKFCKEIMDEHRMFAKMRGDYEYQTCWIEISLPEEDY